jgi:hypothetical protein
MAKLSPELKQSKAIRDLGYRFMDVFKVYAQIMQNKHKQVNA